MIIYLLDKIQFKYEIKSNQKYSIQVCRIISQSFDTKIFDNLEYDENIEKYIDFINETYSGNQRIENLDYISLSQALRYVVSNSVIENQYKFVFKIIEQFSKNVYHPFYIQQFNKYLN